MAQSRWCDSRVIAAFAAMVLIGGNNAVAVRLSDRGLAPFFGAGVRFVSAAVLLYVLLAFRHVALPTRAQLKGTLLYGFFGFGISYAFAYVAMVSLSSVDRRSRSRSAHCFWHWALRSALQNQASCLRSIRRAIQWPPTQSPWDSVESCCSHSR